MQLLHCGTRWILRRSFSLWRPPWSKGAISLAFDNPLSLFRLAPKIELAQVYIDAVWRIKAGMGVWILPCTTASDTTPFPTLIQDLPCPISNASWCIMTGPVDDSLIFPGIKLWYPKTLECRAWGTNGCRIQNELVFAVLSDYKAVSQKKSTSNRKNRGKKKAAAETDDEELTAAERRRRYKKRRMQDLGIEADESDASSKSSRRRSLQMSRSSSEDEWGKKKKKRRRWHTIVMYISGKATVWQIRFCVHAQFPWVVCVSMQLPEFLWRRDCRRLTVSLWRCLLCIKLRLNIGLREIRGHCWQAAPPGNVLSWQLLLDCPLLPHPHLCCLSQ